MTAAWMHSAGLACSLGVPSSYHRTAQDDVNYVVRIYAEMIEEIAERAKMNHQGAKSTTQEKRRKGNLFLNFLGILSVSVVL